MTAAPGAFTQPRDGFSFQFDPESRQWTLGNGVFEAGVRLTPAGQFVLDHIAALRTGRQWIHAAARGAGLFRFRTTSGTNYGEMTKFRLVSQRTSPIARQGLRQTIVLEDEDRTARITVDLDLFAGQPALRDRTRYRNISRRPLEVDGIDVFPFALDAGTEKFRAFRVKQWAAAGSLGNFEPEQIDLEQGRPGTALVSGAHGLYCGWLALRDSLDHGLYFGCEFDGRFDFSVDHTADALLQFASGIDQVSQPVAPDTELAMPVAFVGVFQGDWDEAGYRTQRFVEQAVAMPALDANCPYVMWDSWSYQERMSEATLRPNAAIAARLGVEVFVIDLGWARVIGDCRHDPAKLPNGLRALSDYVHSLGMKFGLHIPLAEASALSPVLRQNPNWRSSKNYEYFKADSLCLSHRPVRDWIIGEALRMIDEYNVDWILQDGENMVNTAAVPITGTIRTGPTGRTPSTA
jgi:alpha-galactosidase